MSLALSIFLTLCFLQVSLALPNKRKSPVRRQPARPTENNRYFHYKGKAYVMPADVLPPRSASRQTQTTRPTPRTDNSMVPSKKEFIAAFIKNKYAPPTDEQYKNFVNGITKENFGSKREVAMFLAQILHESGGLTVKAEERCLKNGCRGDYETKEDFPKKRYYGRGYIQLTWAYNYKNASAALFGDASVLYKNPDLVAKDDAISWSTSFWFWRAKVHPIPEVQKGHFGSSTKKINGNQECGSKGQKPKSLARRRFRLYTQVLLAFNIKEEPNPVGCY